MSEFQLESSYQPRGDQPQAIDELTKALKAGKKHQTLLGVTGSGKTYTMANTILRAGCPALVLAHNKTLAAQLYGEFREFFPHNAVEYFVSYYDYYQPEAYIAKTDTYIAKDSSLNEDIEKLRHAATASLLERRDVIVVASVSAIYGLGSPEVYKEQALSLRPGMTAVRDKLLRRLIDMQYSRTELDLKRGSFRVRGDVVEIVPAGLSEKALRLEFFGDELERLSEIDIVTGNLMGLRRHAMLFPASHYAVENTTLKEAVQEIEKELAGRLAELKQQNKLLEAQRLEQRTAFDLEMLQEIGYCQGIENYSRFLTGRKPGEAPYTLIDYFPDDFILFVDESHVMLPQIRGMYEGDRSRKQSLVDYGFRLPSALDNRPLTFAEFEAKVSRCVYVSATPGDYELSHSGRPVEQVVRPTGLVDPPIEIRPVEHQVDDLLGEIQKVTAVGERVLVTTLTKRMAEDLTEYLREAGVKVRYLHSEVKTLERMAIIRDLRIGEFDVLVGINLLREGLDLPEVALVAILDADKEGFLRSERSLVQTIGRAARNVDGRVIMYADVVTESMAKAISETGRRRAKQQEYNKKHNITPQTVQKDIRDVVAAVLPVGDEAKKLSAPEKLSVRERERLLRTWEKEMRVAAAHLNFEEAARLRDMIMELRAAGRKK